MALEIRKNNIGIQFIVTISNGDDIEDLNEYDDREIIFKKPNKTILTKSATLYTDGSDGKMYCVSEEGDLDIIGIYQIQARLATTLVEYTTSIGSFRVQKNLD